MTNQNSDNLPVFKPWESFWTSIPHATWLTSRFSLRRNFSQLKFSKHLPKQNQADIIKIVHENLITCNDFSQPQLFNIHNLSALEREWITERFLLSLPPRNSDEETFIINQEGNLLVILNGNDHFNLHAIDKENQLEEKWKQLTRIESHLSKHIDFAFSKDFGFLTSDPSFCGTGLSINAYLHLPALLHTDQSQQIFANEASITAHRQEANSPQVQGDIAIFHNTITLGLTEEDIISKIRTRTAKMIAMEQTTINELMTTISDELKNKITLSLGTLSYSYCSELPEALNAISLIKLGLTLGLIKNSDSKQIIHPLLDLNRAHILLSHDSNASPETLSKLRANYLRNFSKILSIGTL
ncbi:hypothetical protein [Candidatus Clavichlamydia salmonicola]|uniref:hypothetical protein n=1 Tax=Candidatus Clavichlamydia salmonicola TaxID=469812 RepID=UPI001890E678|nr:hypothetical protein [Candidatus Clavichlamydia salmonicola]